MSCFHCRDQQAVPWCTGRRVVARAPSVWSQERRTGTCFGMLAVEVGTSIGRSHDVKAQALALKSRDL